MKYSLILLLSLAGAAHAAPPRPITLTHLGVAGWQITDGVHTILVNPYFTRLRKDLPDSAPITVDAAAVAAHAPPKADLVLVTHSHVDHLLDAPAVALRTGAQVVGSRSTANYAVAAGVPKDKIIPVRGGEDYDFDGFSVRVIPGLHYALDAKHTLGSDQTIPANVTLPMTFATFAEGGTFDYLIRLGGHEILIIGSAGFIERELDGLRPDIVIAAAGGRQATHDYSCRLMKALGRPKLVLTNHFDNWRAPADTPLTDDTKHDLADFAAEVKACSPKTKVQIPEPFHAIQVGG